MKNIKMAAVAGSEEDEICRRKYGKWRCKKASADNEVRYCQKHFEEMKKLPLDEDRCCVTGAGGWRCKNIRMNHDGAADDDANVPKSRYCEKHRNYLSGAYKKKKNKTCGDVDLGAGSGPKIQETRGSEWSRKKVMEEDDEKRIQKHGATIDDSSDTIVEEGCTGNIIRKRIRRKRSNVKRAEDDRFIYDTLGEFEGYVDSEEDYFGTSDVNLYNKVRGEDDKDAMMNAGDGSEAEDIFRRKFGKWRCKNASGDNEMCYCEKHYKHYKDLESERKKQLPPDEQRCCQRNGGSWRCKNFRMGYGPAGAGADDDNVLKTDHCEKHYNYFANYKCNQMPKKKKSWDGEGAGSGPIEEETRESRWRRKKKKVTEEEDDWFLDHTCDYDTRGAKSKKMETRELKSSARVNEPVVELGSLDQVFVELEVAVKELELAKTNLELEKKTAATEEDAVEYWRNKCSDLEIVVLALEIEYLTMRYEDRSILRCQELRNSEKIECEAQSLENEISQTGTKQRNNKKGSKSNVETNCEGRKNSGVYESKTNDIEVGSANVRAKREKKKLPPDERHCCITGGGGWRCKNFRMGHGAGAYDSVPKSRYCEKHYNLCAKYYENKKKKLLKKKTSADGDHGAVSNIRRKRENVVDTPGESEDDDTLGELEGFDGYLDSENSVGDLMDMLGMENWNWNKDDMKWNSEADMLSCFEEDPVLSYL